MCVITLCHTSCDLQEGRARPIIRSLVSDDYVGTVSVAVALDIEPLQPGSDPYLPDYPISPRPPLVISPGKREGTSAVRSKFTSVCLAVHISTASDILNTTPLPSVALVADVLTTPTDLLPLINGQFELSQTPEGTWIAPDDGMIVLPFAIPERAGE